MKNLSFKIIIITFIAVLLKSQDTLLVQNFSLEKEASRKITHDKRNNWININKSFNDWFTDIYFIDEYTGWIVSKDGKIYNTTNGGMTWLLQYENKISKLTSVFFNNKKIGWAVGLKGEIFKTINGGKSWNSTRINKLINLRRIFFINDSVGWIVGDNGTILKTINSGKNWNFQKSSIKEYFYSVYFINPDTGWIVGKKYLGTFGSGTGEIILNTTNGGLKWNSQIYIEKNKFKKIFQNIKNFWKTSPSRGLNDVYFIDKNIGWAIGDNSTVFKTTNGGSTWILQQVIFNKELYLIIDKSIKIYPTDYKSVFFPDKNIGYIVGSEGTILKTINGGISWDTQDMKKSETFESCFFINENVGWIIGNNGVILKTDKQK